MSPVRLLRFGPFEFDVRAGDLCKYGVRVHLQEQAAQILLMLLMHPGEVVLRSEIRQQLWPGDTVVDFDQSINSAVKRLRNALLESADTPRYIETISKRGYRFIGEVQQGGQALEAEAAPEPEAPVLARYRLLEKIGEGGVGVVYRAEDLQLGRQVAVKFLRTGGEWPESALVALDQEARAASSLQHPNICAIHGLEDFDGRRGIVMELVGGETLAERLARGPLPPRDALRMVVQTASALAEAHAARIVHRDLKPANIMLTKNGVKVLDFGLTSTASGAPASLDASVAVGAGHARPLQYVSPEQRAGGSVDARSDIFSLGMVLYEMLTGRAAPDGASKRELGDVPPAVAQFLMRCLARNPEARWQSVSEAQTDLERLAREDFEPAVGPVRRRHWLRLSAFVGAGLAIGAGVYLGSDRGSKGPPMRAIPLTTFAGEQNFPAFSRDGEKVAFSWVGPPRQDGKPALNIYVKSILNGETVPVTSGATDDELPSWSPDGSEIAFQRGTPTVFALMIVGSGGGAERKIADMGFGLAWSPDGTEIAYVAPYAPVGNGGILVRSLKTGAVRQLTSPETHGEHTEAWSPDGGQIAFTRVMTGSARELFVVPSQGGEARQLTFDKQTTGGFAWTPDSRELVFDSSRKSGASLWRIWAAGGTPRRVTDTSNHPAFPAIAPRGNRLAYSESFIDTNIWQYDRTGAADAPFVQRAPCLICSSVEDDSPRYSPDGRKIVFVSRRSGSEELWTANSDGRLPVQLTFTEGRTGSPRWSPDGRSIAFDSRAAGSPDIFVVSAQGGAPRQLTAEPSLEIEPSWSHDGRWIYFASDRGGHSHIWKAPFAGGSARQVTQGDGGESLESPDGKRLYYFHREHDDGIWSMPAEGGLEEVVPELSRVKRTRAWTVREEGIYFYDASAGQPQVRFFNFATRQLTTLLTLDRPAQSGRPGLEISPDGRKLLYTQVDRRVDGLTLIENFR